MLDSSTWSCVEILTRADGTVAAGCGSKNEEKATSTDETDIDFEDLAIDDSEDDFDMRAAAHLYSVARLERLSWRRTNDVLHEHEEGGEDEARSNTFPRNVRNTPDHYADLPELVEDWSDDEDGVEEESRISGTDADDEEDSSESDYTETEDNNNSDRSGTSTPQSRRACVEDADEDEEEEEEDVGIMDEAGYIRQNHPKLSGNGCDIFTIQRLITDTLARPCDSEGNFLPSGTPPPPRPSQPANEFFPFRDRLEFEAADFLYSRDQMNAGNIDFLSMLWATSMLKHGGTPPVQGHKDLYETIDAIPLGDIPWQCEKLYYDGELSPGTIPPWQQKEYEIWFRDPQQVVHAMLQNPDFQNQFEYTPFREFVPESLGGGLKRKEFMSGDWAWDEAVGEVVEAR